MFLIHVDDIVAATSSLTEINSFHKQPKSQWEIMELGEPKLALSITTTHNHINHTIILTQTMQINLLVNKNSQSA
jgi:hypothetical protein